MIAPRFYDEARAMIETARNPVAMKRSAPFMQGMEAAVAWWLAGKPRGGSDLPGYSNGSVEMDAWLAGFDAGKCIVEPAKEA